MKDIYINSSMNPLTKFTSSSRNTEFKDILPWSICQTIRKTILIRTRIVICYVMKWASCFEFIGKSMETENNNTIGISQWRESQCKTNTSIRRKKEIQRSKTLRLTVREPSRKLNHLSKIIRDRKMITKFTRSISSTRIG